MECWLRIVGDEIERRARGARRRGGDRAAARRARDRRRAPERARARALRDRRVGRGGGRRRARARARRRSSRTSPRACSCGGRRRSCPPRAATGRRPTSSRAAPPPSRPTRPTASSPSGSRTRSSPRPAATPRPCSRALAPGARDRAGGRGRRARLLAVAAPLRRRARRDRPARRGRAASWPATSRSPPPAATRTAIARLAVVRGRLEAARGDREARRRGVRARAGACSEPLERPYDRAHVQLAHGQFLRREGRRRSAADLLTAAAETFAALGARPALERTERELVASGPAAVARPRGGQLTPQELTVARLVATGHTQPRGRRRPAAQRQDRRGPPDADLREARHRLAHAARAPARLPPTRARGDDRETSVAMAAARPVTACAERERGGGGDVHEPEAAGGRWRGDRR